ncbi:hypothetical protein FNF27_01049 [Cafeteria roenbergensis]|uniref:RRM domain-containing protein n=1 Tax=Cafeteria roenbergensis TaxID=33653 RepID=A0A5A8EI23_CAFRO|nr:hypothetical protein FNF29_00919 [Cafeteria roenbergensis]KAA0177269.1 hypothetical protein FNF27_01049 [Cafeteria roenbergensis]|eukprot:KAA0156809.1 hypothetical protein FNF29_00919 [Cafeteria roenbergensis]
MAATASTARTVVVRGISTEATEASVRSLFGASGAIESVTVGRAPATSDRQRTAEIVFTTPAAAAAARDGTNGTIFPGAEAPMRVSLATYDPTTVFVGNLAGADEAEVTAFFAKAGTITESDVGSRRAYLTFATEAGATAAVALSGSFLPSAADRAIRVERRRVVLGEDGEPLPARRSSRRAARTPRVRTRVFVKPVPAAVTTDELAACMGGAEAGVVDCTIDAETGVGMVEFSTAEGRQAAIDDATVDLRGEIAQIRPQAPRRRRRAAAGAAAAAGTAEGAPRARAPRARAARTETVETPADPRELLVSGPTTEEACTTLCNSVGTVEAIRAVGSGRVTRDGWQLHSFIVTFSTAAEAEAAIPELEKATAVVPVKKTAEGEAVPEGTTTTVSVRARPAGPRKTRAPRAAAAAGATEGRRAGGRRTGGAAPGAAAGAGRRGGARREAGVAPEDIPLDPLTVLISGPDSEAAATAMAEEVGSLESVRMLPGRPPRPGMPHSRRFIATYANEAAAAAAVAAFNGRAITVQVPTHEDGSATSGDVFADAVVTARIARERRAGGGRRGPRGRRSGAAAE